MDTISVEELTGQKDRDSNPISIPVKAANASMRFPLRYQQVKNFFIERFDEVNDLLAHLLVNMVLYYAEWVSARSHY